jgi:hypothetical protein
MREIHWLRQLTPAVPIPMLVMGSRALRYTQKLPCPCPMQLTATKCQTKTILHRVRLLHSGQHLFPSVTCHQSHFPSSAYIATSPVVPQSPQSAVRRSVFAVSPRASSSSNGILRPPVSPMDVAGIPGAQEQKGHPKSERQVPLILSFLISQSWPVNIHVSHFFLLPSVAT